MSSANTIEFNQLSKKFDKAEQFALNAISTIIKPGVITGLVGPDGAGKTTLLRLCAGLLKPSSGQLTIQGYDPIKDANVLRTSLGYMPQKFGLYEDLTVIENINLFAHLHRIDSKQQTKHIQTLLEFTDLSRFTSRLAGHLSGGMKQKLGLACTLISRPKVLLLDEPGVGVDPISRRELWQIVQHLSDNGILVIWSTSYLDEAEMCEHVLLLDQGKLLFEGKPTELTQQLKERTYLIKLPNNFKNRVSLQMALASGLVSDGVIQGQSLRLILKPTASIEPLKFILNVPHQAITLTQARFEDAFIDLLGGLPVTHSEIASVMPSIISDPAQTVIEAVELTKQFGTFKATDNVTFSIKRGEIFGLLGPNGAGKSTTFKMMCGLLTPTSGKALVLKFDLANAARLAKVKLGYMAQKFSLYSNLTVLENLKFFAGIYHLKGLKSKKKIQQMIETFHLSPFLTSQTESLPLGFKQRLALACALMHEPEILFLDEPTSGVDPLTRREFWLHINAMVAKGMTVMVTTHFMDEAEYCDRIGLVYRGKLIATGSPDELKASVRKGLQGVDTMEDVFIELVSQFDKSHRSKIFN